MTIPRSVFSFTILSHSLKKQSAENNSGWLYASKRINAWVCGVLKKAVICDFQSQIREATIVYKRSILYNNGKSEMDF